MPDGYWYMKLNLNLLTDSTFNTVLTEVQRWRYIQLYMLAKTVHSAKGSFSKFGKQMTIEDIAWDLHLDPEVLQADMEALKTSGLIGENGHGIYLVRYHEEQKVPRDAKTRKSDQRKRDLLYEVSRIGHDDVTSCDTESESESEGESESEVRGKSQSVSESTPSKTTDDGSLTMTKSDLVKFIGISKKYQEAVLQNDDITVADLIAELSRNYSRKGNRKVKGKVELPGSITAINLSKGERPASEWYDRSSWTRYLPGPLLTKIGLAHSEENKDLENSGISGYTNDATTGNDVAKKVAAFLGGGQ